MKFTQNDWTADLTVELWEGQLMISYEINIYLTDVCKPFNWKRLGTYTTRRTWKKKK